MPIAPQLRTGSWPTDGSHVMDEVLSNIVFDRNVRNTDTINAVAPAYRAARKSATLEQFNVKMALRGAAEAKQTPGEK